MSTAATGAGGYVSHCAHGDSPKARMFRGQLAVMQRHMDVLARGRIVEAPFPTYARIERDKSAPWWRNQEAA